MPLATHIHELVSTVAPITGVSLVKADNPETWKIHFADEASDKQRDGAYELVRNFDPATYGAEEEKSKSTKDRLMDIDSRSIRAIREYIAARPDATSDIRALEAEATDQRKKLR